MKAIVLSLFRMRKWQVWKVNKGQTEWCNSGQSVLTLYTRRIEKEREDQDKNKREENERENKTVALTLTHCTVVSRFCFC